MKKIVALSFCLLMAITLWAQKTTKTVPVEPILKEVFDEQRLLDYQTLSPSKLLELNYQATHYCYVTDEMPANAQVLGNLIPSPNTTYEPEKISSEKSINPFKFAFVQDKSHYNVYTIPNSNLFVVVYPFDEYLQGKIEYFKQYGH